jgi:hypothetical protein
VTEKREKAAEEAGASASATNTNTAAVATQLTTSKPTTEEEAEPMATD